MARLPNQNTTPGLPAKPQGLPKPVCTEWDRIIRDLTESNIRVAKAHGRLILQAAQIAVDIVDAQTTITLNKSPYYLNKNTGAIMLHPATRRLDTLRRDYIKVLSLLGLRSAVLGPAEASKSMEDILEEE